MTVEALALQKKEFAMVPLHQDPLVWAIRKGVQVPLMPDNKVRLWHVRMD
jgi:peptide/nickel transport system substrate-binding protein